MKYLIALLMLVVVSCSNPTEALDSNKYITVKYKEIGITELTISNNNNIIYNNINSDNFTKNIEVNKGDSISYTIVIDKEWADGEITIIDTETKEILRKDKIYNRYDIRNAYTNYIIIQ